MPSPHSSGHHPVPGHHLARTWCLEIVVHIWTEEPCLQWWLALCEGWTSARGSGGSTRPPGAVGTCHHSPYLSPPHTHAHTHAHACMHTRTCTRKHAHAHAHVHTRMQTHTCTYTDVHYTQTCLYAHACTHTHVRTRAGGHCQVGGAGSPVSSSSLVTCFTRWALPVVPAPPCPPPPAPPPRAWCSCSLVAACCCCC